MTQKAQNGPNDTEWPKMAQNDPKWPRMAQNGRFGPDWPRTVKMAQKDIPTLSAAKILKETFFGDALYGGITGGMP